MENQFLVEEIKKYALPLKDKSDLHAVVAAVGDASYALLGEASHGTSEFYTIRAEISKKLIQEKGFSFIAVEGDWPVCYALNRYVKGYPDVQQNIHQIMQRESKRWPTWMWANEEVIQFLDWVREYNVSLPIEKKVGFYGLDVYSLWESMEAVVHYLEKIHSPELEAAKKAFSCFEPFHRDAQTYGVSAAFLGESCEQEVVRLLSKLQANRTRFDQDPESSLSAELNALVAVNAERYYRSMVRGGNDSWNIRDRHMVEVLTRLMDFHGSNAKAIVWEHNTHVGDARATDMAQEGMVNVGQLVREQQGSDRVCIIGFGTHRGSVIASKAWGEAMESMSVPPALEGSFEDALHQAGGRDCILLYNDESVKELFSQEIGHRAIGVVYHPEHERYGTYVPSRISERYDVFIYVEETHALRPLIIEEILV